MTWLETLERCAWQGTLILSVAFAAAWALRGAPAAWRHFLWAAVLGSLLILPAAVRTMPKWGLEKAPAIVLSGEETVNVSETANVAPQTPPWHPELLVWLAGCALVAMRFLVGRVRTARMLRQSTEARFARQPMDAAGGMGVGVVQSAEARTALAVGIVRPVVVLPMDAAEWPVDRLRAALLHELMHVRRRDLAAQAVAQAACCVYWFHPLAWMAARQLRREREQACDDAVLGRGLVAQEYAGHLVESARALRGRTAGAMAMAEPSELEMRVRALLDGSRDRRPLNRTAATATLAALAVVLLPVAGITVHAQAPVVVEQAPAVAAPTVVSPVVVLAPQTRPRAIRKENSVAAAITEEVQQQAEAIPSGWGNIGGVVVDPSGARMPNCAVVVKSEDGVTDLSITTDAVGAFQFNALPTGKYTLQVVAPGFKKLTRALTLQPSESSTVNMSMTMGGLTESVTVTAQRPDTVAAPAVATPSDRIRVGGNVQAALILRKVAPTYPADQRAQGISGVVHLTAIISKAGTIQEIHALGGPPGLIDAALAAASLWQYRPAMLNGEPVMVETAIDISFELK